MMTCRVNASKEVRSKELNSMTKKEFAVELYQKLGLDFDEKVSKRLASLKVVRIERAIKYLDSKNWGVNDCRFVKAVLRL